MEIEALVKFFGYSAQNAAFDMFPSARGISDRPVYDTDIENPGESIELPERCVHLFLAVAPGASNEKAPDWPGL